MTETSVTVVDYGLGNLYSIKRAIEHLGGAVNISGDPRVIFEAERVILPGVGAFGQGIKNLDDRGLVKAVRGFAESGRPLLGICLGMQLLMDRSEEMGVHEGLGIIEGNVSRMAVSGTDRPHKIPHVGWSSIHSIADGGGWDGTVLKDLPDGAFMYFVHSYVSLLVDNRYAVAVTPYGGCEFTSVIQRGSVSGCQFHPEKSGVMGLSVLRNFLTA